MHANQQTIDFWLKQSNLIDWREKVTEDNIFTHGGAHGRNGWLHSNSIDVQWNCIERHIKANGFNSIAMTEIDDRSIREISYGNLLHITKQLAEALVCIGQKPDQPHVDNEKDIPRVLILMSASLECACTMLTCAINGFEHCVVFEDIGDEGLAARIKAFKPNRIVTRKKSKIDAGHISRIFEDLPTEEISIDVSQEEPQLELSSGVKEGLRRYEQGASQAREHEGPEENRLFSLFTSGTTGEPKTVVHTRNGFLLFSAYTCKNYFFSREEQSIFCATDAGWINGHTYGLYGPLLLGKRTILCPTLNLLSDYEYLIDVLDSTKCDVFYSSVTLLRMIRANLLGDERSIGESLYRPRRLGSCGEPLNASVAKWAQRFFDVRHPIVNTYFQTETGGILIAPLDDDSVYSNGSVGCVDNPRNMLGPQDHAEDGYIEELRVDQSWPGIFDSVKPKESEDRYFDKMGRFILFDSGRIKENLQTDEGVSASLEVLGRTDDVYNVSGHRVAASEIETVANGVPGIIESAAIAINQEIAGQTVILLVREVSEHRANNSMIRRRIKLELTPWHSPSLIIRVDDLPKTRSGKIARRLLSKAVMSKNVDSPEVLQNRIINPECLDDIISTILSRLKRNGLS